jgi:hypothetical protein
MPLSSGATWGMTVAMLEKIQDQLSTPQGYNSQSPASRAGAAFPLPSYPYRVGASVCVGFGERSKVHSHWGLGRIWVKICCCPTSQANWMP